MRQWISSIALVVGDYDDAIAYYREKLQFVLLDDSDLGGGKRWVRMAPPDAREFSLLLAKAGNAQQADRVGDQTGGRVFLFLRTDDFWRDYQAMREREVAFVEEPREEPYGTVVVFEDLYGNRWDLVQLRQPEPV
ncbi:MAG: VOC family protein [Spirochaetota bacterium]